MPRVYPEKNTYFGKTEPSAVMSETEKEDYVETQSPEHTKVENNSDTDWPGRGANCLRMTCDLLDVLMRHLIVMDYLRHF